MAVVLWTTKKATTLHMWRMHIACLWEVHSSHDKIHHTSVSKTHCTISYTLAGDTWTAKLQTNMIETKLIFVSRVCVCVCTLASMRAFVCGGSSSSNIYHVISNLTDCFELLVTSRKKSWKQREETSLVLAHCEL